MKRRAFTLIELLVVLGIIVLIMAIIIPALRLAREYAKSMRCSTNIKQITLKLLTYDLKNENLPYGNFLESDIGSTSWDYIGNAAYDSLGFHWINYIYDNENVENKGKSVFWCPSRRIRDSKYKFNKNPLVANYGVNQSICKSWVTNGYYEKTEFTGHPLSATDIKSPAQTLLLVDSGYYMINWYHVTNSPPRTLSKKFMEDCSYLPGLAMNKERSLLTEQMDDAINGRHWNKSVNIGYADGHVERKKAEDLFVEKTNEGYKNLSPLWSPAKK